MDGKVTHAAGVAREEVVLREWYGGKRQESTHSCSVSASSGGNGWWQLAERTATYFPGIRSLGVDLIMDNDAAEYVFDVDPFGAYLPGLVGGLPSAGAAGHDAEAEAEPLSVRAAVLRSLSADS